MTFDQSVIQSVGILIGMIFIAMGLRKAGSRNPEGEIRGTFWIPDKRYRVFRNDGY